MVGKPGYEHGRHGYEVTLAWKVWVRVYTSVEGLGTRLH